MMKNHFIAAFFQLALLVSGVFTATIPIDHLGDKIEINDDGVISSFDFFID